MSCTGGYLEGEDILFEEPLANKFFHVLLEALAVDSLVSFTIVIRTVFFCFGECRVILNWSRSPHPRLIFDGIEDFVDAESQ